MAVISRLASVRTLCGFRLFFFFFKAQEIDVPLASMGRLATELELHMFSPKMMQRYAELGWAVKFGLVYDVFSLTQV